ncbi:MAG: tRNA (adenosine(37)-N6)-threonylcarbamoyltransferase complex dimerization subunit type 1 TsaB [Hyphomonadaceae bacterium]
MIIMGIDTALDACSIALVRGGETLAHLSEAMQRGQAERIAPMARAAMATAGIAFSEINRVGVTVGPGSFTGVRVGLAFARGLALALSVPCLGVSTLEALALAQGADGLRGGVIATPGALYGALYKAGAVVIAPKRFETIEESAAAFAAAAAGRSFSLAGPGAAALAATIDNAEARERAAADAAFLAKHAASLDPAAHPPGPQYLRAALLT